MPRVYKALPEDQRYSRHINIPLTPPQEQKLIALAERRGMNKTLVARQVLLAALEAEA